MNRQSAFWDASALVPLCIHESASAHARSLARQFAIVVWWGTLVELHSAIFRLHRQTQLTEAEKTGALARLRLLHSGWREILPSEPLRELSTELLERHALRSADALQLAASLMWCAKQPVKRTFICADRRLSGAAKSAGFSVTELAAAAS